MEYRNYNHEKDKEAAHRIWHECGWLDKGKTDHFDAIAIKARVIVADIDGEAECLVTSIPGDMDYLGERLQFSCVSAVTTSLIARKRGIAARLTATRIALDTLDGFIVSGLGIFDQGYYDKLGYGTEAYHNWVCFSPAALNVNIRARVPKRLTADDYMIVHECRLNRMRTHGSTNIFLPEHTRADMTKPPGAFGLGYFDRDGALSHCFWAKGLGSEKGPFMVFWFAYKDYDQFKELLALIQTFGDQVHLVQMIEPPGVFMQDFISHPFRYRAITDKSDYQNTVRAAAWHQRRICNLEKCLEKTHLKGNSVAFNLRLHDPIEKYLDDDIEWRGISGDYVVTLGPQSGAEHGNSDSLPTMEASVGAFTRVWLGCVPVSTAAVSDRLNAPPELIEALDNAIRVPRPSPDWEY
jgi:hypothetical protein